MTSSLQGVEIGLRNEELRAELGKRLQKVWWIIIL